MVEDVVSRNYWNQKNSEWRNAQNTINCPNTTKQKSVLISQLYIVRLTLAFALILRTDSLPLFNKCTHTHEHDVKTSYNQKIESKIQKRKIGYHVIAMWPNRVHTDIEDETKANIQSTGNFEKKFSSTKKTTQRQTNTCATGLFCWPLSDYDVRPKQNELFIIELSHSFSAI